MKTVLAPNAPWHDPKEIIKSKKVKRAKPKVIDKNFEKWIAKQKVDWSKILGDKNDR